MLPRSATPTIRELAKGYPILAVTGPRQSGKTTLARSLFSEKPYVSLEDFSEREQAQSDPRGFLERFPDGAVLDEAQRAPDLFSYLQTRVDLDGRMGLFVLTGSQQFGLLSGVSQSLAGRVALVPLLPFSLSELQAARQEPTSLEELLFRGLYPPIYDRSLAPSRWHANYIQTYLERDVRQLTNVQDLRTFQLFLRMCAARTGQLLNLSSLGADAGISQPTARAWISILEASYILHLVPPHHANFEKRLVKTPKLYFHDPGLAASLLDIESPKVLETHPQRGPLFETWVVSELLKARFNQGLSSNLSFWRDRSGHEVDLLVSRDGKVLPVEVKSGRTINLDFFQGLTKWKALAGEAAGTAWLVYGGDDRQSRTAAEVVPWRKIGDLAEGPNRQDPVGLAD